MSDTQTPQLIDIRKAAAMLGVSSRTLWSIAQRGDIPSVRIGSRRLFDLQDIRQYIAQQKEGGTR